MMKWLVLSLMLAGCEGPPGPAGPQGEPGRPGASGNDGESETASVSFQWVDSAGNIVTTGSDLVWFDDNALMWAIDPATARVSASDHLANRTAYFSERDCFGADLVAIGRLAPRIPVVWDGQVYAVPDTGAPIWDILSVNQDGTCTNYAAPLSGLGVPLQEMDHFPGGVPSVVFGSAPLHPEML